MKQKSEIFNTIDLIPSLDLFKTAAYQTQIFDEIPFTILPSMTYSDNLSPIIFEYQSTEALFLSPHIDLNLIVSFRRKNATTTAWQNVTIANTQTCIAETPVFSCFSDITVECNSVLTNSRSGLFNHVANFILKHITNPDDSQINEALGLNYFDKGGKVSDTDSDEAKLRTAPLYDGNKKLIQSRIMVSLLAQNKLILPGCNIKITCNPGEQTLRYIDKTGTQCELKIEQAFITGRKILINENLYSKIMTHLKTNPVPYQFFRIVPSMYQISKGTSYVERHISLSSAQTPRFIALQLGYANQMLGSKDASCYHSRINLIESCYVTLESKTFPLCMIKGQRQFSMTDSESGGPSLAYMAYKMATKDLIEKHQNNNISIKDFNEGNGILIFNLSRTEETNKLDSQVLSLNRSGSCSLTMRLEKAADEALSLLILCIYDNKITIDHSFNVSCDF